MCETERERGRGRRETKRITKGRRRRETDRQTETETQRGTERERERERKRKKALRERGGRDRQRETESERERETETETARSRERKRERERVREGGRARKKNNVRHILCYKMYNTLHGMKHHTQSQSTFTFCLIRPYQPFNQTRTSTIHNQTTFSLSLYIYIVIFHTAHRATGSSSLVVYSKQYRISV